MFQGYEYEDWYNCPRHNAEMKLKDKLWLDIITYLIHWYEKQRRRSVASVSWGIMCMVRKYDAQINKREVSDAFRKGFKEGIEACQ